jgi:hypothetical protein
VNPYFCDAVDDVTALALAARDGDHLALSSFVRHIVHSVAT